MKKALAIFFLLFSKLLFAQNEIGPEGSKLLWVFLFFIFAGSAVYFFFRRKPQNKSKKKKPLFEISKIKIELEKDALYYPDNLNLKVKNTGNSDVDLDCPLLVFDNFWLKRKFRLKGTANRNFYPLYLEKGKTHTLQIDLTRFYSHDKSLKKFPKASVSIYTVKGKKLGRKSVFLRKTLFKF